MVICVTKVSAMVIDSLQGSPKVRSSYFMHYIFLSKLYFYMKFLKDVYYSIG